MPLVQAWRQFCCVMSMMSRIEYRALERHAYRGHVFCCTPVLGGRAGWASGPAAAGPSIRGSGDGLGLVRFGCAGMCAAVFVYGLP